MTLLQKLMFNTNLVSCCEAKCVDSMGGIGTSIGNGAVICRTIDGGVTLIGRGHIMC